jgi:hypothetical protein
MTNPHQLVADRISKSLSSFPCLPMQWMLASQLDRKVEGVIAVSCRAHQVVTAKLTIATAFITGFAV